MRILSWFRYWRFCWVLRRTVKRMGGTTVVMRASEPIRAGEPVVIDADGTVRPARQLDARPN